MAAPTLTTTAERLYDDVAPLAYDDEAQGYALALYLQALATMLDEVADLSRDSEEGRPGWSQLFDLDTVDAKFLPYVGQFIGVTVPPELSAEAQRARIRSTDGFRRGTPAAIIGAAQQHLTGTQKVYLTERHASAYRLTVATLTSETPDPDAVVRALAEQKPAGLILTHSVIPGGDFDTLRDTHSDFADVTATFANFDELRADPAMQ